MNKSKSVPTEGELEILQVLWKSGPSTVREVNDILKGKKHVGYTTTLKLLQIMNEKGLVSRKKSGKSHIYEAAVTLESTRQQMVDRVLNTVFQGSASKLVMQALGSRSSSKEDLDAIRKYLESLDIEKKEDGE